MGIRTSVWAGGLACVVAVGALACALPSLWRYDARTDPHARALAAAHTAGEEAGVPTV
jgi:hypothetical protein